MMILASEHIDDEAQLLRSSWEVTRHELYIASNAISWPVRAALLSEFIFVWRVRFRLMGLLFPYINGNVSHNALQIGMRSEEMRISFSTRHKLGMSQLCSVKTKHRSNIRKFKKAPYQQFLSLSEHRNMNFPSTSSTFTEVRKKNTRLIDDYDCR